MDRITVEQDGKEYVIDVSAIEHEHFGTDKIYAVVNFYTDCLIYNLDFDETKYEKKVIVSTT